MTSHDPEPRPADAELPLQEATALRRLARSLLFDASAADDVVQEAWLVALRRGLAVPSPSAWLRGVVRRLALQKGREEARRRHREERAALGRGAPALATDELSGRLERTRRVLDAVDALAEPYRTLIVLRFFDGLPPREIAKRRGVPVNTVRTQLGRGLARLRQALASRDDEPELLLGALLPLAGPLSSLTLAFATGSSSLSKWIGALLMSVKTNVLLATTAAVVLVAASVGYLVRGAERAPSPVPEEAARSLVLAPLSPATDRSDAVPLAASEPVAEPERAVAAVDPTAEWRLSGQVLGGGQPLAGARVEVQLWNGYQAQGPPADEATVVTDDRGAFAWGRVAPAGAVFVEVVARRSGWLPTHIEERVLSDGDAPDLTLDLRPEDAWVLGRVVDEAGAPIAGARLRDWIVPCETDADGRFRLPSHAGRAEVFASVRAEGFADRRLRALVAGPGEVRIPDLVLAPEADLRGRVVDEAGVGLAGARVSSDFYRPEFVLSGPDGRFALPFNEQGDEFVTAHVELDGWAPASRRLDEDALAGSEFEVVLRRGVKITGTIADELGQPVEGVELCLDNPPDTLPHVSAFSDAAGRFRYDEVRAGTRRLYAARSGFELLETELELHDGASFELTLQRGHSLGGVVQTAAGEVVPGALAYAESADQDRVFVGSVRADESGRFRFEALPDSPLTIGFLHDGFVREELRVTRLDQDDLVVTLRRAGRLSGRVVDGRTGEPVDSFVVRLADPLLEPGEERLWGYGASWSRGFPFVGPNGAWSTGDEDLDAGKWIAIEVLAEGYSPGLLPRVRVTPDAEPLLVELFPGAHVDGQVVDRVSGEPVAGARVRRFTAREPLTHPGYPREGERSAVTDAHGRFTLADLPLETMSLAVESDAHALTLDGRFDVGPGERVQRLIQVDQGAAVRGLLTGGDGEPLAGEWVHALALDGPLRTHTLRAQTDARGAFTIAHLRDGEYQVAWALVGDASTAFALSTNVTLDGADAELELRARGQTTIVGRLEVEEGPLPASATVTLRSTDAGLGAVEQGQRTRAAVARDGRFELPWVAPGAYRLRVDKFMEGDRFGGELELVVPAQGVLEVVLPCARTAFGRLGRR